MFTMPPDRSRRGERLAATPSTDGVKGLTRFTSGFRVMRANQHCSALSLPLHCPACGTGMVEEKTDPTMREANRHTCHSCGNVISYELPIERSDRRQARPLAA